MSDSLRDYTRIKLNLADQLRIVCDAMSALGLEKSANELYDLMTKLAEDRFTLAVVGQFKRGKSSLMNAIIGRELLPVGVLPLTSVITTLKYGPNEKLLIHKKSSSFITELPITALNKYVTENGNPGNAMGIERAYVELPVSFLRRGLEFVDTPGIGSAIAENTEQTYSFLPKCDAVIFVTGADTPLTSLELDFSNDVREHADKIFFVINKTDLVNDGERDEIINYVSDNIKKQTGQDEIKLFPVSARMGLEARLSDDARYEKSGIKELENALASFLSVEKAKIFLAAVSKKALNIVKTEADRGAFREAALQAWEIRMQQKDYVKFKRDPHDSATAIAEAYDKIKSIQEANAGDIRGVHKAENIIPVKQKSTLVIDKNLDKNDKNAKLENKKIIEDLQTRTCPVCRHLTGYIRDFYANFQYEIATNENAQKGFANGLGFCPLHTWQLLSICSPHGASIGFAEVSEQAAFLLPSIKSEDVCKIVKGPRDCQVCEMLRKEEKVYTNRLLELLSESTYKKLYDNSQGVCIRHLGMLINTAPQADLSEFLIFHSARRFEEDAEDMRNFALKHDARRRYLENIDEEDAYRRAIIRLVGGKDLCAPWAEDGEI